MHLTLIHGGKAAAPAPRPVATLADLPTRDLLMVQRSTLEELIRNFHELKATWEETKAAFRQTTLGQAASRRDRVLALATNKEVGHV